MSLCYIARNQFIAIRASCDRTVFDKRHNHGVKNMMKHTMQTGSASSDEIMSRLLSWFSGVEINVPVYLVGGCVRDILMGNRAADLDLASPKAESLAKELARANWAGLVRMEKDRKSVV